MTVESTAATAEQQEQESNPKYRMTVSLNVLNHLGIGLYSNIPAVLSELVANAWDADANQVKISIDPSGRIVVEDDGYGMTLNDINERFLKVGYRRRVNSASSPKGRAVMGRKGIGKLSSFSIANIVEVHTVRGAERNALRMNRARIEEEIKEEGSGEYHPEDIEPQIDKIEHGTRIVLRNLDKNVSWTAPHLRRRLARRFSVIGPANEFHVVVNESEVTSSDRDFYNKLEFLWHFGKQTDAMQVGNLKQRRELDANVDVTGNDRNLPERHEVWGWIGTVDRPDSLDEVNNSIVLLARGKLVHENLLPQFKEAGMYAQYVVGEINADFLDDDGPDIVTSNRQSVKEDDPRYGAVCEFVQATLKKIKNDWTGLRQEEGKKRALTYPSVERWYNRLGMDGKRTAERLFARIESLMLPDLEAKKELYRSTMLAFEKLALHDMLSVLDSIESQAEFETLSRVMVGVEEVEAFHYHEVALGRLKVIEQLRNLVDKGVLEKVLQKFIFRELWLLHPSWERAASNTRIEETDRHPLQDGRWQTHHHRAEEVRPQRQCNRPHLPIEEVPGRLGQMPSNQVPGGARTYRDDCNPRLTPRAGFRPREPRSASQHSRSLHHLRPTGARSRTQLQGVLGEGQGNFRADRDRGWARRRLRAASGGGMTHAAKITDLRTTGSSDTLVHERGIRTGEESRACSIDSLHLRPSRR